MNKLIKKAVALTLVLALLFANGITAFAATAESAPDTHISVREFFEASGGAVEWDSANRRVTATLEDDTFVLYPTSRQAFRNGEAVTLSQPVVMHGNMAYMLMSDLLILFGMDTAGHLGMSIATFVDALPHLMADFSVPGLTIAVVDAQEGFTWVQGFGYADSVAGTPVDEYTLFQLASISKPFTAIAVMQLVEAGVVALDEPIATYLPEFSIDPEAFTGLGDYSNITVRMLMSHASGIQPDLLTGMLTTGEYYTNFMDNFLENLSQANMASQEATVFSYANNAFTLLGYLVAAVATDYDSIFDGFASYAQENIFDLAGMDLSTFALTEKHMPYLSGSYAAIGAPEDFIFINALPTGGLISNAYDMARFMHIILNDGALPEGGRLLSANSIRQMFTRQQFGMEIEYMLPGMNMQPGLGFIYSTSWQTGFTHSGHGGNMIHFHSYMAFDLDSGIGVFIAVNSIIGMPLPGLFAPIFLTIAVQEKTGTLDVPASVEVEPIEVDLEELQALEGFYFQVGGSEFMQVIASEDGYLYMHGMVPGSEITLLPLSDGSFISPEIGLRLWFEDVDGEILIFLGEFGTVMLGGELNPELFLASEWLEQWVGSYYAYVAPGHVSNLFRLDIGIDANGFGYMRTNTLNGLSIISPILMLDEYTVLGGVSFTQNDDGTWLFMIDGRFLRAE